MKFLRISAKKYNSVLLYKITRGIIMLKKNAEIRKKYNVDVGIGVAG